MGKAVEGLAHEHNVALAEVESEHVEDTGHTVEA